MVCLAHVPRAVTGERMKGCGTRGHTVRLRVMKRSILHRDIDTRVSTTIGCIVRGVVCEEERGLCASDKRPFRGNACWLVCIW